MSEIIKNETFNFLEKGKNPGLGIKKLHEQGIEGNNIHIAIIDQNLDLNHPEYKDSIVSFQAYGDSEKEEISMHGPAVASILAGKSLGVAPKSKIHYFNVPAGGIENSIEDHIQALRDIVKYNLSAMEGDKIKIVSLSAGLEKENLDWLKIKQDVSNNGIVLLDSSIESSKKFGYLQGGSNNDKDNFDDYKTDQRIEKMENISEIKESRIIVPSEYRTIASSWEGVQKYQYDEKGGISWSIPYVAGVFAMALQVNPKLTESQLSQIFKESAIKNKNGYKVINPKGIVDLARSYDNKTLE